VVTFYDASVNVAQEVTYGTRVTPARAYEFTSEKFDFNPTRVMGQGLRVGSRVLRSGRRITPTAAATGSLEVEALTKGMGILLDAAMGASSLGTLTTGTQFIFTLGDSPKSLSIQKAIPNVGGTLDNYDMTGAMVTDFTITAANNDVTKIAFNFDGRMLDTAQTFATLAYPATPNLYHFGQAAAAVSTGSTVTAPSATALGTVAGGTPATAGDIRSFELTVNNNLKTDRYNLGQTQTANSTLYGVKSKPTVGLRTITGKFVAEYTQTAYRDYFLKDNADVTLNLTWTTTELLFASNYAQMQVLIPAARIDSGVPMSNNGDIITVEHSFTVMDGLVSAQPMWLVLRSADTAL